jgi:hypothetical protein
LTITTAIALSACLASCGTTHDHHAKSGAPLPQPGFSVFAGSPTSSDALPDEIATQLPQNVDHKFAKADIRDARRVLADDPGWLVPAANAEICLVQLIYPLIPVVHGEVLRPAPSTSCASEASAQAGRLVGTRSLSTSTTRATKTSVTGIVPNGVSTVTIVSARGQQTIADVMRNAYEAVATDPVAVRFVTTSHGKPTTHTVKLATFTGGRQVGE